MTDLPILGSGLDAAPIVARMLSQPGVQKVPSPKLDLFLKRGFLDADLCAGLIERIDAVRRPSTIADPNGDAAFRTSETGDLFAGDAIVQRVEALLAAFTGLDPAHGEPLQGQRYAVGQEFKGHTDYFEPKGVDYERYCSVAGNRTWTVMVYLNEPEAGGATRFKAVDKIVQPETGKLVAWNNRRADGSPNPATLHQGMKVRAGTKYVITKWYRERPWG
ncbi:2OG-Fe(II) oxygenase [Sphingomonas sp. RP10(2022)]|uniref:2OG-Fe(II) oxygenase n=1 Tax=Sphingomonas liriopis TaxID=2949094 RepID=A0A9X2HVV8_9SPHN|nr:2OG-Fe(II) oxygenase [Sphingomonas liriopis]MCP3734493.1 2OG-Fe(II) oxygenase [Sphingomonas liriopis]